VTSRDIASFAYLWNGSEPGWTLHATHRQERRTTHYLPVNELTNVACIIEDDADAEAVIGRMLREGVPVRRVEVD
jgi:hypothetical protein